MRSCSRVQLLFLQPLLLLQAYCPLAQGTKLSDPELVKLAEKVGKTPAQVRSSRRHSAVQSWMLLIRLCIGGHVDLAIVCALYQLLVVPVGNAASMLVLHHRITPATTRWGHAWSATRRDVPLLLLPMLNCLLLRCCCAGAFRRALCLCPRV